MLHSSNAALYPRTCRDSIPTCRIVTPKYRGAFCFANRKHLWDNLEDATFSQDDDQPTYDVASEESFADTRRPDTRRPQPANGSNSWTPGTTSTSYDVAGTTARSGDIPSPDPAVLATEAEVLVSVQPEQPSPASRAASSPSAPQPSTTAPWSPALPPNSNEGTLQGGSADDWHYQRPSPSDWGEEVTYGDWGEPEVASRGGEWGTGDVADLSGRRRGENAEASGWAGSNGYPSNGWSSGGGDVSGQRNPGGQTAGGTFGASSAGQRAGWAGGSRRLDEPGAWSEQQQRQQQRGAPQPDDVTAGAPPFRPSDITVLSQPEVERILPLPPSSSQAAYYQPRTLQERVIQLAGSVGASVILSKSAVLAAPALLFPVWNPWIRAGLRNLEVSGKASQLVGLWHAQVLDLSIETYPLQSLWTRASAGVVRLLVGDPWEGGARARLEFPYQPRCETLQMGETAELLVLSADRSFGAFKVVRELYLPEAGVWLADYPFLQRDEFLALSLNIERARRAAISSDEGLRDFSRAQATDTISY